MGRCFIDDEGGAASVLVIFMMLALVTLGAYSITSARVNYTFSGRALEWRKAYYGCDAKAREFLADADNALAEAERDTIEAIMNNNVGAADRDAEQAVNSLFHQNVIKKLSLLSDKYNADIDDGRPAISAEISMDGELRITVKIAALPFRYSLESEDGAIRGVLNKDRKRYAILEWREAQKARTDSATQAPLWDGVIN